MLLIPQHELYAILAHYSPYFREHPRLGTHPVNARTIPDDMTRSIGSVGYLHGRSEAQSDPWDYTAGEMANAIAEYYSRNLATDYANAHHAGRDQAIETWKQFLTRIVREDDPANGGLGILTPDPCPDCDGQGIAPSRSGGTVCPDCNGTGTYTEYPVTAEPCQSCNESLSTDCPDCGGYGVYTSPHCGWRHCTHCNDANGNPTRRITGTANGHACSLDD